MRVLSQVVRTDIVKTVDVCVSLKTRKSSSVIIMSRNADMQAYVYKGV